MSSSEASTGLSPWDLTPARRPILADVNNASLEDDSDAPPDWTSMPTSNLLNGEGRMMVAVGQVAPNAVLSVAFAGGSPVLDSGVTAAGVSPGSVSPVLEGEVTVLRTPGGAGSGDIFLWWPTGTFPSAMVHPSAGLNGIVPGFIASDWYTDVGTGHSGIRVVTKSTAGAATDLPFSVDVP